jgi:hypothetical protein
MKARINVYLEPGLLNQVEELAARKRLAKSSVIEAAVASFLSPDAADRREAAFTRRLDRLTRQLERLERDVTISAEALALFVRFWLSVTPSVPDSAQAAAKAKGTTRYQAFIETLGRRLASGQSLLREISQDTASVADGAAASASAQNSDLDA